jgi:hypothetical protein
MTLHDRSGLAGTLPRHRPAARHGSAHPAPSALSISPRILAAKITSPGLSGWTVPRPRITEFDDRPGVFWAYVAAALAVQDPPVTLALDDLHVVTEPQVLKELDFLLRNAAGLRLVVASRIGPAAAAAPLPGSRAADRDPRQRPSV